MRYPLKICLITMVAATALFAIACGLESDDVASLEAADAPEEVTEDATADVETAWMAFTECLRDNGLDVEDPVVDANGLVQKPEPIGDTGLKKKDLYEAYEACDALLVGVTIEIKKGEVDTTEYIDGLLELAECLRGQGIDVDDPDVSAEKPGLDIGAVVKKDWESPAMQKAREACDVEAAFGGVKGK